MKASKEGNKVIIEVEESDIPLGQTMEMAVDALFIGTKAIESLPRSFAPRVLGGEPGAMDQLRQLKKDTTREFQERWEILPES
jgi:hypothetical protein